MQPVDYWVALHFATLALSTAKNKEGSSVDFGYMDTIRPDAPTMHDVCYACMVNASARLMVSGSHTAPTG